MAVRRENRLYFATPTGRRYHADPFCTGLNSHGHYDTIPPQINRHEITRRSLTPCGTCSPPPVIHLRAV